MAGQSYRATRDVVIAGKPQAEGSTFTAAPESVAIALTRGWVEEAQAKPKRKPKAKEDVTEAPISILVQTFEGTSIEPIDHEPAEAELAKIKAKYIGSGHDVISVRVIGDARLSSRIGPLARPKS